MDKCPNCDSHNIIDVESPDRFMMVTYICVNCEYWEERDELGDYSDERTVAR